MCQLSARIRSTERWWTKIECRGFRAYWTHEGATVAHTVFTSSGKINVSLSAGQVSCYYPLIPWESLFIPDAR